MSILENLPIELKFKIINMNRDECIDCSNNKLHFSQNLEKCSNCNKSICLNHQKYKCNETNKNDYLCFFCSLDHSCLNCVNCNKEDKHLSLEMYKCALCDNLLCSEHSSNTIDGNKYYGINCCKYCSNFFFND